MGSGVSSLTGRKNRAVHVTAEAEASPAPSPIAVFTQASTGSSEVADIPRFSPQRSRQTDQSSPAREVNSPPHSDSPELFRYQLHRKNVADEDEEENHEHEKNSDKDDEFSQKSDHSGNERAAEVFGYTAMSLGMDNDDLLFNLMYFGEDSAPNLGSLLNRFESIFRHG